MSQIITISRQHGAGGKSFGKLLSEALQIPIFDAAIVTDAAKSSGFDVEMFDQLEQRGTKSFFYALATLSAKDARGIRPYDALFEAQAECIRNFAADGPCVVVGRCSDYILRNVPNVLHLFLHAKLADRVERKSWELNVPIEGLAQQITKLDKQRAAYYKYYTGQTWGAANRYHLALNTSTLSLDECLELVKCHTPRT